MQRSILIVAFGFSRAAQAQATGAEKTAAEALSGESNRPMDQGKFGEACPKFADSQKLDSRLLPSTQIAAAATRIGCN